MAYTRVEYIHRQPQLKIRRFSIGDPSNEHTHVISLVSAIPTKIGDSAIESARITANKVLEANSNISFFLKIAVYPHEILREHKLMGFAGADRVSQGMSRSFGKATKRAAKVSANQPILIVYTILNSLIYIVILIVIIKFLSKGLGINWTDIKIKKEKLLSIFPLKEADMTILYCISFLFGIILDLP